MPRPAWPPAGGRTIDLEELLDLEQGEEERRQRELLEQESPRQLRARGLALPGLRLAEREHRGARERLVVTLQQSDGARLPFHLFRVGGRVQLQGRGELAGTLVQVGASSLVVELDGEVEADQLHGALTLLPAADTVTMRRMRTALAGVRRSSARLVRVVQGREEPQFREDSEPVEAWFDQGLNEPQREAVRHTLRARDLALIHGPPGTGKTRTVTEVIRQAARRGERVLACAPSNLAVDGLAERLAAAELPLVRLGHPARVLPGLQEHTLEARTEQAMDPQLHRSLRAEERALQRRVEKGGLAGVQARPQLQSLRRDLRELYREARRRVLHEARVVLATCAGAADPALRDLDVQLVVIDEAAQCLEPLACIPLLRGERLVLAGDHQQLPPTVLSVRAAREGLARSIFERLVEHHGESASRLLQVQYRMHRHLMDFLSAQLYGGRLQAHPSVAEHTLEPLPPLCFLDTAGASMEEERREEGESCANHHEARILQAHLEERVLGDAGLSPGDVAVIAPYAAQVELLRSEMGREGLEIDTVDGFQGREKEAVLVSLVRSNPAGEIGFLREVRRMNVALSRARRHLLVVGDSSTVGGHPFYGAFVAHVEAVGGYETIWERR